MRNAQSRQLNYGTKEITLLQFFSNEEYNMVANSRRTSNLDVLNSCAVLMLGTKQCFTITAEIFSLSLAYFHC